MTPDTDARPTAADTCRAVDIGDETIRVRGAGEMSEQAREALAAVVAAARRRFVAEHPEQVPATASDEPPTGDGDGRPAGGVLPAFEVTEYTTDRGTRAWAWRCWGTPECDGGLGLDHDTQRSAQRGLERHQAEHHPGSEPARRALLALIEDAVHGALTTAEGQLLRGHVDRLLTDHARIAAQAARLEPAIAEQERLATELKEARRDAEVGWKDASEREQDVTEWAAAYSALIRRNNDIAAQLDSAEPGAVVRADELVPLLRAGQPAQPPSAWVGDPKAVDGAWARAAVEWEQRAREAEAVLRGVREYIETSDDSAPAEQAATERAGQDRTNRLADAQAALARVRDLAADMREITGARHWADMLNAALNGAPGLDVVPVPGRLRVAEGAVSRVRAEFTWWGRVELGDQAAQMLSNLRFALAGPAGAAGGEQTFAGSELPPGTTARLLAELDAIEAEHHGQHDEDDDGAREVVARIRRLWGGVTPPATS
jgi:hypothetical protein